MLPDSGTQAAIGYSRAAASHSRRLIKNRYVGPSSIQPDQALRDKE